MLSFWFLFLHLHVRHYSLSASFLRSLCLSDNLNNFQPVCGTKSVSCFASAQYGIVPAITAQVHLYKAD